MSPLNTNREERHSAKSRYSAAAGHAKLDDFANNIYLLLFQRILTLIGAPLIVYFVMDISASFKEMSENIVDLRIEITRVMEKVANNKEDIKELKADHKNGY